MKARTLSLVLALVTIAGGALSRALPVVAAPRDPGTITDWYIQDFRTDITVNLDSSLTVVEEITADCGNLPNKHGIYRILPTVHQVSTAEEVRTPVHLQSITNFAGEPIPYAESIQYRNRTITWKIGDPNRTVNGVNQYRITYRVGNAVSQAKGTFDELYWNLNGNYWQLQTDAFSAVIHLPDSVPTSMSEVVLYSGSTGATGNDLLARSVWLDAHTLQVASTNVLRPEEGITLSLTMPKEVISPYTFTADDQALYSPINQRSLQVGLPLLGLPILVWLWMHRLWRRYGKDPKGHAVVAPEFGPPENLAPIEMGVIWANGTLRPHFITAGIISLAVQGYLKIEQVKAAGIRKLAGDDYRFLATGKPHKDLPTGEKLLLEALFRGKNENFISSMKNSFYRELPPILKGVRTEYEGMGLLDQQARWLTVIGGTLAAVALSFVVLGAGVLLLGIVAVPGVVLAGFLTGVITVVYLVLMPRRTPAGRALYEKIEGFKLYMETAERYRSQFNEKENILERFLPYAVMFGITKRWIARMREVYGEEYVNAFAPVWFVGGMNGLAGALDGGVEAAISGLSQSMRSTALASPSSSGSGGGGFSGGGGGGGGGGGW